MRTFFRNGLIIVSALSVIYIASWLPWLVIAAQTNSVATLDQVPASDTALVFGGLHVPGSPLSETNTERLRAAIALYDNGRVETIIISNTAEASQAMRDYLIANEIPDSAISIDSTAEVTEDTCVTAASHISDAPALFVSHGYHLPRITLLCGKYGVAGTGIPAEHFGRIERTTLPWIQTATIRYQRYRREAQLTLLSLLGLVGPTTVDEK